MTVRRHSVHRLATVAVAAIAGASMVLAGCASGGSDTDSASGGTPVAGGELKVGIVGGSTKDTLDAHIPVTHPDQARVMQLYDTLVSFDPEHKVRMGLADSVKPSADAKTWTVHLRDGLKFSDGSPITAKDVVFTFQRITDPKDPKATAAGLSTLDRDGIKADGEQTVIFPFKKPFVDFNDAVGQYGNGIVPVGYDPKKPVSSGPFVLKSFTPGQQSVFVKNPNFWRKGEPYLDQLTLINFPDDTARVNALLGGQVDAVDQLPLSQVNVVKADPRLKVLESQSGAWIPFTMRIDQAPFDDARVRQAFRLIVNREQMVKQVLDGHGTIGNDMYGKLDACYPTGVPQRKQDIAKAKQLLAAAGKSNLTVDLVTSPIAAGTVEAAQVFAEQAKEAGVTIKVKKVDTSVFFGERYLSWTFSQDFWNYRNYLPQAGVGTMRNAVWNETHWKNEKWAALVEEASSTLDEPARCKLISQAQKIEHDEGGYIIWGFPNAVDGHDKKVQGLVPDKSGLPLTSYGFRSVWIRK